MRVIKLKFKKVIVKYCIIFLWVAWGAFFVEAPGLQPSQPLPISSPGIYWIQISKNQGDSNNLVKKFKKYTRIGRNKIASRMKITGLVYVLKVLRTYVVIININIAI